MVCIGPIRARGRGRRHARLLSHERVLAAAVKVGARDSAPSVVVASQEVARITGGTGRHDAMLAGGSIVELAVPR